MGDRHLKFHETRDNLMTALRTSSGLLSRARDKSLSRLFGLFSEEVLRAW